MPEGYGVGIGIVGSEPTQRREHEEEGGPGRGWRLGSEMQPGKGLGLYRTSPGGAQEVGGLRWGRGGGDGMELAWPDRGNPILWPRLCRETFPHLVGSSVAELCSRKRLLWMGRGWIL